MWGWGLILALMGQGAICLELGPDEEHSREPKTFRFPFDNSSLGSLEESEHLAREGRQRGLVCHSCGSLFSKEAPACEKFNPNDSKQRMTCGIGEACMLYTWKKSRTEIGSYRECFSTSILLGHPDFPILPAEECRPERTQADSRSSIRACLCTKDFCNDVADALLRSLWSFGTTNEGSPRKPNRREQEFKPVFTENVAARSNVICPDLAVFGADFADCDGNYSVTDETVEWAKERPVYAHQDKDRYIFWNSGGLGWSIGKRDYLSSGSHWHRSGLDTKEPWEGAWENDVRVECVGKSAVDCLWSGFTGWSKCSSTCGVGLQRRQRKVLQPAQGGGNRCQGQGEETRACQAAPCPVNCQWGNYGVWTKCSQTCGGGTRTRKREIARFATPGGRDCLGEKEEVQSCQTVPCPGLESNLVEQGRAIQDGPSGCCKQVRVRSTGRARIDQALYMGTYTRQSRDFNGHAVYKREGSDVLYIYFFTSRRDQLSLWVIGPQLGQFIAGVRNSKTGACVHDLGSGWKYASRAGVWEDNDPSLSIDCEDSLTTQQQGEAKRTTLTTTTKSVFRDSPSTPGKQNCVWSDYGPWSECSKSCDRGNQIRLRRVQQQAREGGKACRGGNRERRFCNRVSCPRNQSNRQKTTTAKIFKFPSKITTVSTTTTLRTTTTTKRSTTTTRQTTTTTIRTTTTTRKTTTTTKRTTRSTRRTTTTIQTTTSLRTKRPIRTTKTTTRRTTRSNNIRQLLPKNKFQDRVQCWVCGSLFSTDAPDCPSFDKSDPAQLKTCDIGEACLFYSWTKSNSEKAVIRECFPTSILLGSIDDPVEPTPECSPIPVESDNIRACICTTDFCSGIEAESDRSRGITDLVPITTQRPQRRTTASPVRRREQRVQCHQCGSLFSSNSPNPDCKRFEETDLSQQGFCGQGEACLWYSYQKNPTSTAYVRECLSTSILLGSIDEPLKASSTCVPQDISESSESRISACLCDSDFCNSYQAAEERRSNKLEKLPQETPRRQSGAGTQSLRKQTFHPDKPGLQCYSCGSLLNPNKKCDKFDRKESSQVQTCLTDEACLMYTWKKSSTETATLRECFPTRVLLGSISDPLVPLPDCEQKDITDDGSGTIYACLCNSDFCNDSQDNPLAVGRKGRRTTRRPQRTTRRTVPPRRRPPTTRKSRVNTPRNVPQRLTTAPSRSNFPQRQQVELSCPPDFELVGGSCYFISDDRVGWIEARKMCELRGARLLSLETETERVKVVELITKQTRRRRSEYWLSGNDIETEGEWEWAKARTPVADFGWIEEPFNSPEENCLAWTVTVSRSSGSTDGWHGSSCCNNLRYLCQL